MALEGYFQEADADVDASPLQKAKSVLAAPTDSDNAKGCFDCNICLDFAQDPVVTLCGHLYCWPCIYKWLHFQRTSSIPEQQLQQLCPVCKADVSQSTLVPLFGRGQASTESESAEGMAAPHSDLVIPRRPPACGVHALITTTSTMSSHPSQPHHRHHYPPQSPSSHLYQHPQYHPDHYSNHAAAPGATPPMFNLGGTTTMSVFNPIMGMFGEMVYARVFGSPEVSLDSYSNSNYVMAVGSSPRVRRQEMQADKSLNRISIFLFCCFVLCLLLF